MQIKDDSRFIYKHYQEVFQFIAWFSIELEIGQYDDKVSINGFFSPACIPEYEKIIIPDAEKILAYEPYPAKAIAEIRYYGFPTIEDNKRWLRGIIDMLKEKIQTWRLQEQDSLLNNRVPKEVLNSDLFYKIRSYSKDLKSPNVECITPTLILFARLSYKTYKYVTISSAEEILAMEPFPLDFIEEATQMKFESIDHAKTWLRAITDILKQKVADRERELEEEDRKSN